MEKITILLALCLITFGACQQKVNKETSQKETTKEITTEAPANNATKATKEKESTLIKIEPKTILDTIIGISTDGETLKVLVYKYLYPNNKKYLRDFDIIDIGNNIILSAMKEEYHWRGLVNDTDKGEVNLIPTYSIVRKAPLNLTFGFYINPYDLANELENYTHSSVRYYLSNTLTNYQFEDSVMSFMNLSINDKELPIEFSVKIDSSEIIPTDSIYTLLKTKKENTSWGMTTIIDGSFINIILGTMTYEQIKSNPLLIEYSQGDDGRSIRQYMIQSFIYHTNSKEYKELYKYQF